MPKQTLILLTLVVATVFPTSIQAIEPAPVSVPTGESAKHDIRPGKGVTRIVQLSSYLGSLDGTPGDTPVYILDGRQKGGTVLVTAGTHENELAGVFAAILLIERAQVARGRLIVIPRANNSAVTWPDPERPAPESVALKGTAGLRRFPFGARLTNPSHQGAPDPPYYRHPSTEKKLAGMEARNLDRAYPGCADGTLTERIAFAIVEVLRREAVDIAFDLHEAPPDSRLAWMLVAHPKGIDLAATAIIDLDARKIPIQLESSDQEFRGLSHREWGDATKAFTFLIETPNPNQRKNAGAVDPVTHPVYPLSRRVGVQLATVLAVLAAYDGAAPDGRRIDLTQVPEVLVLERRGIGANLN